MRFDHDPIVAAGITGLALLVAVMFVLAVARSTGRMAEGVAGVVGWYGLAAVLAVAGVLGRFDLRPPPMLLFMAAVIALALGLGLSPLGARVAEAFSLVALVGAQAFRLPLELVMHHAANERIMPMQLSYSGFNLDILVGILAVPLAWWIARGGCPRWAIWAWNLLGFATLAMIAAIAVATTPIVAAFGSEPHNLNLWVTHFPYVWLAAGPVVFALAGHIVVTRRLRRS